MTTGRWGVSLYSTLALAINAVSWRSPKIPVISKCRGNFSSSVPLYQESKIEIDKRSPSAALEKAL